MFINIHLSFPFIPIFNSVFRRIDFIFPFDSRFLNNIIPLKLTDGTVILNFTKCRLPSFFPLTFHIIQNKMHNNCNNDSLENANLFLKIYSYIFFFYRYSHWVDFFCCIADNYYNECLCCVDAIL